MTPWMENAHAHPIPCTHITVWGALSAFSCVNQQISTTGNTIAAEAITYGIGGNIYVHLWVSNFDHDLALVLWYLAQFRVSVLTTARY